MSYFFGNAGTSGLIKTRRKKHVRHRSLSNDRGLEPVHGITHRRRHSSDKKCISKAKSVLKESQSHNYDGDNASIKNKNKRCLHKEIVRLVEENRLLTAKLEGTKVDLGNLSIVKERDELLATLEKKYHKLQQNYYELQTSRDKVNALLAQRENEFRQLHMHNEESALIIRNNEQQRNTFIATIQRIKNENVQMHEDVNLLKNLVYRLNLEIEKYQDKLRTIGQTADNQAVVNIIDEVRTNFNNKNVLKAWGKVNFHALGPLLDAYQENVNEKDELIQKYKKEIDEFSGKLKDIISENENLHIEVENMRAKYDRYVEEAKVLEKDAAIVKEQNELLIKQSAMQKQKIQEIHSIYEHKVESMSQDNNKLYKEYLTCKTELSTLKGKYEILNEGYEKLKNISEKTMPISVHNAAIDECKRLFEELKQQYESEKKKSSTCMKQLEEILRENEKQLITITAERDQLRIQARNLEKNLKRTHNKLEHLQSTVQSIQVSRDSFKRQLNKTTLYCEELVKEQEKLAIEKNKLSRLLEEKEKENENIQYLGNNITHRMGTLKNQLKARPNFYLILSSKKQYF
ncbi:hypothetical protein TSAR_014055 [Trichomalopsis sarcophagae]|uniref:Uncharacterized protein n=1 Tax=Trichomalopsis sarcophagae TaxID=543379 RepID=A0A232EJV8_9HYME|nr:hypothetical protein TSAR_014055 [Trichomalopsis sarcophagae]